MARHALKQRGLGLTALALLLLAGSGAGAPSHSNPSPSFSLIPIDGHNTTIAQATAKEITPWQIAFSLLDLVISIIRAVNAPEFDYWGNVQAEVEALVGDWINAHNMHQIEAYERDLETLMLRYVEAPAESATYADKNQQAAALSTSIIAHRYLVTSGDLRFSLILHFEDIASQHVAVLTDAAETYSTDAKPSQWWVDVDAELGGYLEYLETSEQEFRDFRMGQIECYEQYNQCGRTAEQRKKTCYDIFTITDGVTGESSECKQLAGSGECADHCETYRQHREQEIDAFVKDKVRPVEKSWKDLQAYAQTFTPTASRYYTPARYQ